MQQYQVLLLSEVEEFTPVVQTELFVLRKNLFPDLFDLTVAPTDKKALNDSRYKQLTFTSSDSREMPEVVDKLAQALTKVMPWPMKVYDVSLGVYRRKSSSSWEPGNDNVLMRMLLNLDQNEVYILTDLNTRQERRVFVPANSILAIYPSAVSQISISVQSEPIQSYNFTGINWHKAVTNMRTRNYCRTTILYEFHTPPLNFSEMPTGPNEPVLPDMTGVRLEDGPRGSEDWL